MYNVVEDPFCMNNLADDEAYAELKTELSAEMTQKLTEQAIRVFWVTAIFLTIIRTRELFRIITTVTWPGKSAGRLGK
jgi:hypothetical protein